MLKIAVCDDNPDELKAIRQLISRYTAEKGVPITAEYYSDRRQIYAIYAGTSRCSITINGGTVSGERGVYTSYSSSKVYVTGGSISGSDVGLYLHGPAYISGGTIFATEYGIDIYGSSSAYLSGAPVIEGGEADVRLRGSLYANDGASTPTAYMGGVITLYYNNPRHTTIAVKGVTEANKSLFAASDALSENFGLGYDSENSRLYFEGKEISLTWFDSDGTTVLTGAEFPETSHYCYWIDEAMPIPQKDGYIPLGWRNRMV